MCHVLAPALGHPSQVARDSRTTAAMAIEDGDLAALELEAADWRLSAARFLNTNAQGDAAEAVKKKPRVFRKKAYEWCISVEHCLQLLAGKSLLDYQIIKAPGDPYPADPASWPSLTISIDQGTDGFCAINFLQSHLHCNIFPIHDASHRVWNDAQLALQDCKLWSLMLAFNIACNCDHGPWSDARFYSEAVESTETYLAMTSAGQCPLFQMLLPKILADKGLSSECVDEELEQGVFSSLTEAFAHKIPKVAMSRWFGINDALNVLMPIWHSRLCIMLFMCVSAGWIEAGAVGGEMVATLLAGERQHGGDMPKAETAKESEDLRKLRSACRNTLHFTATLLCDGEHRQILQGILLIMGPVRAWHGHQNSINRSCDKVVEWYMQQACGQCLDPLLKIAALLLDPCTWEELGIWAGGRLPASAGVDDPSVMAANDLVAKICQFAMALIARRTREAWWHCMGYPGSFAALLDEHQGPKVMQKMQRVSELWPKVMQKTGAFWKKVKKGSLMNNSMMVQQAIRNIEIGIHYCFGVQYVCNSTHPGGLHSNVKFACCSSCCSTPTHS